MKIEIEVVDLDEAILKIDSREFRVAIEGGGSCLRGLDASDEMKLGCMVVESLHIPISHIIRGLAVAESESEETPTAWGDDLDPTTADRVCAVLR